MVCFDNVLYTPENIHSKVVSEIIQQCQFGHSCYKCCTIFLCPYMYFISTLYYFLRKIIYHFKTFPFCILVIFIFLMLTLSAINVSVL